MDDRTQEELDRYDALQRWLDTMTDADDADEPTPRQVGDWANWDGRR